MNTGIPKRIIQTGKTSDLPLLSKAVVANIRLLNPDFEYLFFDNDQVLEFIDQQFPKYRQTFNAFRVPIQRYDFFRYLAVYHFGGFYFDLDVFLAFGLSPLLEFSCVFPFEEISINKALRQHYGMDWEIGNYAFGAAAGHPFLRAIIENCVKSQKDEKWVEIMMKPIPRIFREDFYVLNTTGPGVVSRTLAEYPDAASEVKVLFPENVCDPAYWHRFGSFGVHLQEATWRRKKSYLRRRLTWLWASWRSSKLLEESRKFGEKRSVGLKTIV
ncbi:MAG: hypothetical protein LBQ00_03020 [Syntrophobacterales bacterium]|jgi:hypothetical protein|nr:hypothetical protein [Syntrophobacterales bacterium]